MHWRQINTTASMASLRTLLFCINIVFIVTGAIIIFLGFLIRGQLKQLPEITPEMKTLSPNILLGFGLIIFLIGLSAFWCTIKSNPILLYIYSFVNLLIFIAEVALAITFLMQRQTYETAFKTTVKTIMNEYPQKPGSSYIDRLQKLISCCGIESYTDWFETPYGDILNRVPESCCKKSLNHTCIRTGLKKENLFDIYTTGCYTAIITKIKNNYPLLGGLIILIALVPLVGTIVACCLARQISKYRYERVI